jgi:hypothetical protein
VDDHDQKARASHGEQEQTEGHMSLHDFMAAQAKNADALETLPHFSSLIPLVGRMYDAAAQLAAPKHSPTLGKLLMVCHREFLVAASQIIRGLPLDSHANTRRAVEVAKVALAFKRNVANVHEWLKQDLRQRRWSAREEGKKPERLPSVRFPELDNDPLVQDLQQYFGIASDTFVHFTPEFFALQEFSETPDGDGNVSIGLNYITSDRDILLHAAMLCGLHVRILHVFDAVFDGVLSADAGWKMLRATFDELAKGLWRDLTPLVETSSK